MDWKAADRVLLRIIDANMQEAAANCGAHLACRPGCTACCLGPFPIHALDAERLRGGLAELRRTAPERAGAVHERARAQCASWSAGFPGNPRTGWVAAGTPDEEEFCEGHRSEPCPALDPETGLCELYAWRPVNCRTYGPPVRIGAEDLPPCSLCFPNAGAAEIEAARITVDPDGFEDAVRACLGADEWTYVAHALGR